MKKTNIFGIRGNSLYPEEVIEILEKFDATNKLQYTGCDSKEIYYISPGDCSTIVKCSDKEFSGNVYETDELKKLIKFWPGENVINTIDNQESTVERLIYREGQILYVIKSSFRALSEDQLLPKEFETMEGEISEANNQEEYIIKIPKGYKIKEVKESEIVLETIEPYIPKTFRECCVVLGLESNITVSLFKNEEIPLGYLKTIDKILKLIICRDAYWKVLCSGFKPNKEEEDNYFYCEYDGMEIPFPDRNSRDLFKENIKNIIT